MEELPEGTEIAGRYVIVRPVAAGAMGEVYVAEDSETGDEVAVKLLLDRRHALRVELEARVLQRLRHPRVVRYLDHVVDPDVGVALVMDLIRGLDLERTTQQRGGTLELEEAIGFVTQAASALSYVHAENTIHRDVKPCNLILGPDGVVLVDFGIAREPIPAQGTIGIGTPGYMAPEVLSGAATPRSDVYGLGATLWRLVTGRPPRLGEADEIRPPELPGEIGDAVRAALAPTATRRLPSAAAFAEAIGRPLEEAQGAPLAVSEPRVEDGGVLEAIVRAAAGIFDAAAASLAFRDEHTGGLRYAAAWGAGADEVVGMRLAPGQGIAGAVVASGRGELVPECRTDERFAAAVAARTGYVANTMALVPLMRDGDPIGVLTLIDRRDGSPFGAADLERAELLADIAARTVATDGQETVGY